MIEEEIEIRLDELARLEALPQGTVVECWICGGSAHPECGCGDGRMTREEAIRAVESDLEILQK